MQIVSTRNNIMSLANILTTLRIILAPCCILFILWDTSYSRLIAFVIFVLAFFTDVLDGYAARAKNEVTDFGKFYDPLADKILMISVLFSLAFKINALWCWIAVGVICSREIFIALMRRWRTPKGVSIEADNYGKFKTWIQGVAICTLIFDMHIAPYLLWIAVLFSIFSGIRYINSWKRGQKAEGIEY